MVKQHISFTSHIGILYHLLHKTKAKLSADQMFCQKNIKNQLHFLVPKSSHISTLSRHKRADDSKQKPKKSTRTRRRQKKSYSHQRSIQTAKPYPSRNTNKTTNQHKKRRPNIHAASQHRSTASPKIYLWVIK